MKSGSKSPLAKPVKSKPTQATSSTSIKGLSVDEIKQKGKLLERFKITVSEKEYIIELYNQDVTDDQLKKYSVIVNGTPYSVEVESLGKGPEHKAKASDIAISHGDSVKSKKIEPEVPQALPVTPAQDKATSGLSASSGTNLDTLSAPMPGKILEIKTKLGDRVEAGQPLVILEAMKMENVMPAPTSGVVKEIPIEVGINVNQGDVLVVIE